MSSLSKDRVLLSKDVMISVNETNVAYNLEKWHFHYLLDLRFGCTPPSLDPFSRRSRCWLELP